MTSKFNIIYGSAEFEYTIAKAQNTTVEIHNNIGWSTIGFYIVVPTGGAVKLQGTYDDSNWFDLNVYEPGSVTTISSMTSSGSYNADILGMRQVRFNVTSAGSADGSVTGKMMKEQKYVDSQLEIADLQIGVIEIKDGTTDRRAVVNTNNHVEIALEELDSSISTNSNSQLKTTIYDEGGTPASVDDNTESLQIINHTHHKIHSGNHYFIRDVVDLANGAVRDIRITTPYTTTVLHFDYGLESENETEIYFYEGVTINTEGTDITPMNNDRDSGNTSDGAFDYIDNSSVANADSDTDIRSAITMEHYILGSNQEGGSLSRDNEIMLKPNRVYCLRLIANAAGFVNYRFEWYEHVDKSI